jgi:hypothetical protein
MHMNWILDERRLRRSPEAFVALRYQLEHAREQGGLEALVLADDDGLVVAASGDSSLCAELGAIAPLMVRSIMGLPMPPLLRGAEVAVRPIRIHGRELYLVSMGGGTARDALLTHSITGVHRILASN